MTSGPHIAKAPGRQLVDKPSKPASAITETGYIASPSARITEGIDVEEAQGSVRHRPSMRVMPEYSPAMAGMRLVDQDAFIRDVWLHLSSSSGATFFSAGILAFCAFDDEAGSITSSPSCEAAGMSSLGRIFDNDVGAEIRRIFRHLVSCQTTPTLPDSAVGSAPRKADIALEEAVISKHFP
ncbi:MAG: hypothetical protein H6559_16725 [Lewinellaceae bacterium]|nr:hypothetical protein [Lewinellaceae bacterium]